MKASEWKLLRTAALRMSSTLSNAKSAQFSTSEKKKNTLLVWLMGHRSKINHQQTNRPVGKHFSWPDHFIHDLTIMVIEKIYRDDTAHRRRKSLDRTALVVITKWTKRESINHTPPFITNFVHHRIRTVVCFCQWLGPPVVQHSPKAPKKNII